MTTWMLGGVVVVVAAVAAGCAAAPGSSSPDASVTAEPPPDGPSCALQNRACPDLGYGYGHTLPYGCSDGTNPATKLEGIRCVELLADGGQDYCCCVERYPGQVWPCAD